MQIPIASSQTAVSRRPPFRSFIVSLVVLLLVIFVLSQTRERVVRAALSVDLLKDNAANGTREIARDQVRDGLSASDWDGIRAAYEAGRSSSITSISQEAYLKPAAVGTTQANDNFGYSVAVSGDTVVVGAYLEDSSATGVNSTPDEVSSDSGSVYIFVRSAGVWTQEAYLKPAAIGTTQVSDNFGNSVAVSGDTVVVGAPKEDSSATGVNSIPDESSADSGAAYVFTRSAGVWTQQAYLKPAAVGTTQVGDRFGVSVAVSGDTAVVGAYLEDSSSTGVNSTPNDTGGANSGAAYVFTRSGSVWTQQAYLKPAAVGTTQAGDQFGGSVSVSGDTVIVGAPWEDSSTTGVNSTPNENGGGSANSGAAYVFTRSGSVWTQQAYLKPAAFGTFNDTDFFGQSVAVSGDTVVVGAPYEDSNTTGVNSTPNDNNGSTFDAGAAYIFSRSAGVWTQQAFLKPAAFGGTQVQDLFGWSVAVSGETIAVGAIGESSSTMGVNSTPNEISALSGAVYVFTRGAGVWTQQAYLKPDAVGSTQAVDFFGFRVAVSGDTVVIGADHEDSSTTGVNSTPNESAGDSGAAYVFAGLGPSTPTSTPTNTPTFTPTNTPTATATSTFTPTPTPLALNAITSYDAAFAGLCAIGVICDFFDHLTLNQKAAADVNANCAISPIDSALIRQYVTNTGAGNTTGTTISPPGPCANFPITVNVLKGDITGSGPFPAGTPPDGIPTPDANATPSVSLPFVAETPGVIVVPITVGDLTGLGIYSYDLQVSFDPSVVTPASPSFSQTGTISSTGSITANTNDAGHLIISAIQMGSMGEPTIIGSGTLLNLRFNVVGTPGQSTALTFADYTDSTGSGSHVHQGFLFNEGLPTAVTTNGGVLIPFDATATNTPTPTPTQTPSISGTITYGNAIGNPAPPRFVKNVSVASTSGSPPVGPVITGTPGTYLLTGFGPTSYTIKPTKPGGSNGAITSNDAARVAQGVVSSPAFVSQNQRFAADTSGNGNVTSNDAALIARFAAGLTGAGNAGQWKFFITGAPSPLPTAPQTYNDSRTYASVTSNLTGEDYIGILVGEVSGNWNPATHPRPAGRVESGQWTVDSEDGGPERGVAVELPQVAVAADKEIVVPVNVQGVADKGIISYEFDLRYDPSVIQPQENPVDVAGTVSRGLMVVTNPYEPGLLRVVVYGAMPIDENGVLLNLRFSAVGGVGSISYLKFENLIFNEGTPRVTAADGFIELVQ